MKFERLTIYPKDIQRITGRSERYGRLLMRKIKQQLNKEEHHLVTVHDFCAYTGLEIEMVKQYLRS